MQTRLWEQATGENPIVLVHIAPVDFNPDQLKRWKRSGCAVHVYVTAVLICVTSCVCLWIRNMCSDSLLAEPGDMEPKQPHIHLAWTRRQLNVKEVMLYVSGSSRSRLLHKTMHVRSSGWQQSRQDIDKDPALEEEETGWCCKPGTANSQVVTSQGHSDEAAPR